MNHTPGPWILAASAKVIAKDSLTSICDVYSQGENYEWQPNAKLIAAAPDLLEALEAIRIRAFEAKKQGLAIGMSDIFAITNNAINKATQ